VPDDVGERLERLAEREGLSLSALATRELASISRRAGNRALLAGLPDLGVGAESPWQMSRHDRASVGNRSAQQSRTSPRTPATTQRTRVSATVQAEPTAPRISQHRVGAVAVLCPRGGLDFEVAEELRELALGAHAPVVIDLRECVLIHPESIHRLAVDRALYRPQLCLVCPRQSGRELLRLAAVDEHLAIFATVERALEALERGKQWTPSHATDSAPIRAAR
jgi:hypothetical protein